jgi:Fe2+ transport system protein B
MLTGERHFGHLLFYVFEMVPVPSDIVIFLLKEKGIYKSGGIRAFTLHHLLATFHPGEMYFYLIFTIIYIICIVVILLSNEIVNIF